MAKKAELTIKNFDAQLSRTVSAIKNQTEHSLQEYLVFGFKHYLENGDSGLVQSVINKCVGVPALKTRTMEEYVMASTDLKVTSVEIKKGKNAGKMQKVLKREKSGADIPRVYNDLGMVWCDFEREVEEKEWDDEQAIKNLIKKYEKELPNMKGKRQQTALKRLVSIKAIIGDESLTEIKSTKKAA